MRTVRSGVTVVELLVALGVVSLILSLTVPAIQSLRERSRRMECENRLRQIGVAIHGYESTHRHLPRAGEMPYEENGELIPRSHAPHLYLAPFLGATAVFDSANLTCATDRGLWYDPPTSDPNYAVRNTRLPLFLCPSDPNSEHGRNSYRANLGLISFPRGNSVRQPSYKSHLGPFMPVSKWPTFQAVTDGLSNTVAFSERSIGDGDLRQYISDTDIFYVGEVIDPNLLVQSSTVDDSYTLACSQLIIPDPQHDSSAGEFWLYGGLTDTWYNHLLSPNSPIPDCGTSAGMFGSGVVAARSRHNAGVNVLLMDGSCRFVNETVSTQVWRAIGTRSGGETESWQ